MKKRGGFVLAEVLIALVILGSLSLLVSKFMLAKNDANHRDVLVAEIRTIQQAVIHWLSSDSACVDAELTLAYFRNSVFATHYPRQHVMNQLTGIEVSQYLVKFTWQLAGAGNLSPLLTRVPNSGISGGQLEVHEVMPALNCDNESNS